MAILSCHQFTSINFITGCLIRYTCLNSRLTVFVSCLRRLLVVSRLRLRTLAWRSLAIIRRLLIPSRASRQFIACEIFYEYPMVWYHLILSLLKVHFCQKVLIFFVISSKRRSFLYLKIWIFVIFKAALASQMHPSWPYKPLSFETLRHPHVQEMKMFVCLTSISSD